MAIERKPAPSGIFVNDLNASSVREKQPVANRTKIEETEHAEKIEHAPSDPAPDQIPGGPLCLAASQPDLGQADSTDWRADLLAYLLHEVLPEERNAARRVAVIDGELYKRSPSKTGILMKCIPIAQGKELLLGIHAGIYGHHAPWSERLSDKDSIGQQHCATRKKSSVHAKNASSKPNKPTCRPKPSRPSP